MNGLNMAECYWMIIITIFMISVNSLVGAMILRSINNRYYFLDREHAKLSSFVSDITGRLGEIESVLNSVD